MFRAAAAVLLAGAVFLHLLPARADECPDAEARVAFVRARLDADAHDARRWMWEWGLGYTGLALGQAGLALTRDDRGEQVELYVGAAKSALGLVPVLALQVPALRDAGRLPEPGADRCAVVAQAETMLAASADDEAFNRGFLAHAGNVAVNLGGLLVIGIGYDRWATGALGTAVGIAVGEWQIWSRPAASLHGRDEYRSRWTVAPVVTGETTGISLVGLF